MEPNIRENEKKKFQERMVGKIRRNECQLPKKKFVLRNSVLTDLFENEHIRTVYHIFIATFLGLFVNTLIHDYLVEGEFKVGLRLIRDGFKKVHYVFLIWIGYYVFTCLSYAAFLLWARIRINLSPKSELLQLWDRLWLLVVSGYYIFSFRAAQRLVSVLDLPPASCAIVVLEQTRLLMKVHAFVRTNAENVVNYKVHSDKILHLPKFSHFVYFTFAPTLVYRDEYPRTKTTNWNHVLHCVVELVGIVFYYSFVIERMLQPAYRDFGIRKFTKTELILSIVESSTAGILLLLTSFYLILHCIQNLFAELLRFGDRMFYKDWWRCTSFSEYYRTWNVIVHDWLYTYIYKDVVELIAPNRTLAKITVFFVSAIVHEWVLTYMFGFFLPVLFLEFFIFGTLLNFVKGPNSPILNILVWWSLAFGTGFEVSMFAIEYYARKNAPKANETMIDFFIPRFLTCDGFV